VIPLFNRGQSFLFLFILFLFFSICKFYFVFVLLLFFCTSVIQILYLFGNLFVNKNF